MKSGSWKLWLGLVLMCGAIASLEYFDLHPEFSVGRFHSLWVGVRHMEFSAGTRSVRVNDGKKVMEKNYGLGPMQIAIEH